MRRFFLEDSIDYGRYRFTYRPMAELESAHELPEVLAAGFLPYSADLAEPRHLFYLARSLRYDLPRYALDKKRRYDFRRIEQQNPDFFVLPKEEALNRLGPTWEKDATEWMTARFGRPYLASERLAYVLEKPHCSHFVMASLDGQPFGYALLGWRENSVHYWYAFFDNDRFPSLTPGKWLMARTAQWARAQNLSYLYVGTGYGEASAYKTQGVAGAEFFDGTEWNTDLQELKRRQATDPK